MNSKKWVAACATTFMVVAGIAVPAAAAGAPSAPRSAVGSPVGTNGDVSLSWTAPTTTGKTPLNSFGASVSTDGTTWSAITWTGSTTLATSSAAFPALRCTNVGSGATGKGCSYRIYARNGSGTSGPSGVVKLWASPTAPRTLAGTPTDATFEQVGLSWLAPTTLGGFTTITYVIEAAVDGGAATTVGNTTSLGATVPCTGASTCVYDVRASTAAGTSGISNKVTIKPLPGPVQSLQAYADATDLGAGTAQVLVHWFASTIGATPDHYELQSCVAVAGTAAPCGTNAVWTPSTPEVIAAGANPVSATKTCGPSTSTAVATCYYRIRSVNARNGVGGWKTIDVEPWAAYNVHATPGPSVGKVTITFGGPAESGPGARTGTTQKRYHLYQCSGDCASSGGWVDTGVSAAYPPSAPTSALPSGSGPYLLGVTDCAANVSCSYRVVFTNGEVPTNLPSLPTASFAGLGSALTLATPTTGSTVTAPTFSGSCTIGEGNVAIAVAGPTSRTIPMTCTPSGIYTSTAVSPPLPDGVYLAAASQHGGYSASSAIGFTVDTTAPVVTIANPTSGAAVGTSDVTLGGACGTGDGDVSVTVTGTPTHTVTTPCTAATWSTTTALPDGGFSAVARQTDAVGNTGTSTTVAFTVDTVAPNVTVTAPTAGQYTTSHTPTLAGACETASGTVTATLTNTATNATTPASTSCSAGAWTTAAPSLPDATYTVQARQTDAAGNTGLSNTITFTVDSTAPVVTVTAPADGAYVTASSTIFGGSCNTGDGAVTVTVTGPPSGSYSATCTAGSWATTTPLPDATYTVHAAQTDAAGNTGTSANRSFTVDTTAPDVSITTPASGASLATHTPTIAGTCSSGDGAVTVTITGTGAPAPFTTTCAGAGTWTTTAPTLADGSDSVQARQTDAAGNPGNSASVAFTIDTAAPVVTITNPTNGSLRNTTSNSFSGTCETASGTVTVTIKNTTTNAVTTKTPTCASAAWTTTASLSDGPYTVKAAQTDAAVNTGTSTTNAFTIDTDAPTVSITNPSAGASRNSATNPFAGACTTGDGTVTVTVTNTATSAVTTLSPACTAAAWSASATLADGSYTVTATQTDAATNTGTSATVSFAVDTVAPTVTVTNPTAAALRTTATNAFGGACDSSAGTVTVTVTNATTSAVTTLTPTCTAAAWSASTSLGDAPYTVRAKQTDAAGNLGQSTTISFTVDATAPTVSIAYPIDGASYNATQWTTRAGHCTTGNICGTTSDTGTGVSAVTVRVARTIGATTTYWNGSTFQSTTTQVTPSGTTASWNIVLAAANLTNGASYTITTTATDGGGLTGTATATFTYDTSGPSVSSVTSTNKNSALASGDTFVVTFDDSIDPSSLGGTPTLTITDGSNNNAGQRCRGVTRFQISGLMATAQSIGANCAYLNQTTGAVGTPVTYAGSFSVLGGVVTFTVGSCTTNCTFAGTVAGTSQTSWTFVPSTSVTDVAGNANQANSTTIPAGAVW